MFLQLTGTDVPVPTAISGLFPGELSIVEVVTDLVGLEDFPPGFPEITLSGFSIHAVGPPGEDIETSGETTHFEPGLSLSGAVNFFGLTGSFLVEVDPASGNLPDSVSRDDTPCHVLKTNPASTSADLFDPVVLDGNAQVDTQAVDIQIHGNARRHGFPDHVTHDLAEDRAFDPDAVSRDILDHVVLDDDPHHHA